MEVATVEYKSNKSISSKNKYIHGYIVYNKIDKLHLENR